LTIKCDLCPYFQCTNSALTVDY